MWEETGQMLQSSPVPSHWQTKRTEDLQGQDRVFHKNCVRYNVTRVRNHALMRLEANRKNQPSFVASAGGCQRVMKLHLEQTGMFRTCEEQRVPHRLSISLHSMVFSQPLPAKPSRARLQNTQIRAHLNIQDRAVPTDR